MTDNKRKKEKKKKRLKLRRETNQSTNTKPKHKHFLKPIQNMYCQISSANCRNQWKEYIISYIL